MSTGDYSYDYDEAPKRVSAKDLKARAEAELARLRDAGEQLEPIASKGNQLARKFWGKAWCFHISQYADYDSRLPQGRSCLRNGCVLDFRIAGHRASGRVLGEQLYSSWVEMAELDERIWAKLKALCEGELDSLVELLKGNISEGLMQAACDPDDGLFPQFNEIRYSCTCPDHADMCKHVAAVMYAIGMKLDQDPALLFSLRGVDPQDLIDVDAATDALVNQDSGNDRRRKFSGDDLGDIFGVEVEE